MEIREGLTFDDILLVPEYSEVISRSLLDVSVNLGDLQFKHPIIPANMLSISGEKMVRTAAESGGLAILHRFMPLEDQLDIINRFVCATQVGTPDYQRHIGVSVGVKDSDKNNVEDLYTLGARIFCIDIAHGNSKLCVEMIQFIKHNYPDIYLIAGNVATGDGARRLWEAGADILKIGVGAGSLCTTRIETGNGVPQLTALMDVQKVQQEMLARGKAAGRQRKYPFISDGGIKNAGDIVKALCFADMVMAGNIFAGCEETSSSIHVINGLPHKEYVGSSTHKTNHIEGVEAWVPCTGRFGTILTKMLEGLRSGMSYQGVNNLQDLKEGPQFVKITSAGLKESHSHDVIIK
ncbi:MAG: guanosine monophosphate reductase [Candidatus Omnitrophica bacterium]|nr:guanosine monophosphate reductase [Candidatus Omnitrophota bacterium]